MIGDCEHGTLIGGVNSELQIPARLSDGRTLRATDLLAVSSLLGCWDQPRKLHVCPGRYGIVVGSRVRGRSRDARPDVSSLSWGVPRPKTGPRRGVAG